MKTIKLYDEDAYATEFDAVVLSCEETKKGYAIILDQTLFFPEEGGQKADVGFLDEQEVLDVQMQRDALLHITRHPFTVGQSVHGKIDFSVRYHKMQNHTGEHIVCGLFHTLYGLENVGFHLGSEDVTFDLSGEVTREDIDRVEELANEIIYQNLSVIGYYPSAEELSTLQYRAKLDLTENVRIVTIEGVDICACCAPHVRRTGEVGIIKLLDFMRYKGGVRIHMQCGRAALMDYRKRYTESAACSALMSVKQNEIAAGVQALLDSIAKTEAHTHDVLRFFAERTAKALLPFQSPLCLFEDGLDMNFWRQTIACASRKQDGIIAFFMPKAENTFAYTLISRDQDLRDLTARMNKELHGRGGGKGDMTQGCLAASKEEIIAFFATIS